MDSILHRPVGSMFHSVGAATLKDLYTCPVYSSPFKDLQTDNYRTAIFTLHFFLFDGGTSASSGTRTSMRLIKSYEFQL